MASNCLEVKRADQSIVTNFTIFNLPIKKLL